MDQPRRRSSSVNHGNNAGSVKSRRTTSIRNSLLNTADLMTTLSPPSTRSTSLKRQTVRLSAVMMLPLQRPPEEPQQRLPPKFPRSDLWKWSGSSSFSKEDEVTIESGSSLDTSDHEKTTMAKKKTNEGQKQDEARGKLQQARLREKKERLKEQIMNSMPYRPVEKPKMSLADYEREHEEALKERRVQAQKHWKTVSNKTFRKRIVEFGRRQSILEFASRSSLIEETKELRSTDEEVALPQHLVNVHIKTPAVDRNEHYHGSTARQEFFQLYHKERATTLGNTTSTSNASSEEDTSRHRYLDECEKNKLLPLPVLDFAGSHKRYSERDEHLNYNNYYFGDTRASALAHAIEILPMGIKHMSLQNTGLKGKGSTVILDHLVANKPRSMALETLNLSHNKIGIPGCAKLGQALGHFRHLLVLDLSSNALTDAAISPVFQMLSESQIQTLDVSHNQLYQSVTDLTRWIESRDCTLRQLNLGWNRLRDKPAEDLATSFGVNQSIECLNLSDNGFGKDQKSDLQLMLSLRQNEHLTELNLANNFVQPRSILVFMDLVREQSHALRHLILNRNPIGPWYCGALVQLMMTMVTKELGEEDHGFHIELVECNKSINGTTATNNVGEHAATTKTTATWSTFHQLFLLSPLDCFYKVQSFDLKHSVYERMVAKQLFFEWISSRRIHTSNVEISVEDSRNGKAKSSLLSLSRAPTKITTTRMDTIHPEEAMRCFGELLQQNVSTISFMCLPCLVPQQGGEETFISATQFRKLCCILHDSFNFEEPQTIQMIEYLILRCSFSVFQANALLQLLPAGINREERSGVLLAYFFKFNSKYRTKTTIQTVKRRASVVMPPPTLASSVENVPTTNSTPNTEEKYETPRRRSRRPNIGTDSYARRKSSMQQQPLLLFFPDPDPSSTSVSAKKSSLVDLYGNISYPSAINQLCDEEKDYVVSHLRHWINFQSLNPTGSYCLNLSKFIERWIFQCLMEISLKEESEASDGWTTEKSSQHPYYYGFRNVTFNHQSVVLKHDHPEERKKHNLLSYILSQYRPPHLQYQHHQQQNTNKKSVDVILQFDFVSTRRPKRRPDAVSKDTESQDDEDDPLSEEMFEKFYLEFRSLSGISSGMKLIALRSISIDYYFTSRQVERIMECFGINERSIQGDFFRASVFQILYARIIDERNLNFCLDLLTENSHEQVQKQLGILNILNPLKPCGVYRLNFSYQDERRGFELLYRLVEAQEGTFEELRLNQVFIKDIPPRWKLDPLTEGGKGEKSPRKPNQPPTRHLQLPESGVLTFRFVTFHPVTSVSELPETSVRRFLWNNHYFQRCKIKNV